MSIAIIGSEGSMGKRYQAILRYLGKGYYPIDLKTPNDIKEASLKNAEGYVIATPTNTHVQMIRSILPYRKPILCEKPVCKNTAELSVLFKEIEVSKTPFRMMFQYALLSEKHRIGKSIYNYFRHGSDGLYWDCLQIIALSRGSIELAETSPIWTCLLNGKALKLHDMDPAYVGYVQKWLQTPQQDLGAILSMHEKVSEMEKRSLA